MKEICQFYRLNLSSRLLLLSSSWVMIIFHCRTFSNTIESILLSIIIMLIFCPTLIKTKKVIFSLQK